MPSPTKVVGPAVARPYLWFGSNKWEGQVQAGTVDALDFLTDGDNEQATGLLTQTKEELAGDLEEAGEGLIQRSERLNEYPQYYGTKYR